MNQNILTTRLVLLADGLDAFPAGVPCPWPLARLFNELLRQTKAIAPDDTIVTRISTLKQAEREDEFAVATTSAGTVRALIAQILVVYQQPPHS